MAGATGATGPIYARTTIVSPAADAQASGTALLAAIAEATPSAASPWLIHIEPGNYDVQGTTVAVPEYVDVEGSGVDITVVTHEGSGATFQAGNNSQIRLLTAECTGDYCEAIINTSSQSPSLLDVDASCDGAECYGVEMSAGSSQVANVTAIAVGESSVGFYIWMGGTPTLINVFASAQSDGLPAATTTGILIQDSAPVISGGAASASASSGQTTGVDFEASSSPPLLSGPSISGMRIEAQLTASANSRALAIGLQLVAYVVTTAELRDCQISGDTRGIGTFFGSIGSLTAYIAETEVADGVDPNLANYGITLVCVDDYDGNFQALNQQCLSP